MKNHDWRPTCDSMQASAESLLHHLCTEHGINPVPSVQWSTRMRKTLGRAYPREGVIKLSCWLDLNQAMNTVRHELAHIAVGYSPNEPPHGAKWRQWATRLGAEPKAVSPLPPARGINLDVRKLYWGLECSSCGSKFLRARVKSGLYHRTCGVRAGSLKRSVHDVYTIVSAWVRDI